MQHIQNQSASLITRSRGKHAERVFDVHILDRVTVASVRLGCPVPTAQVREGVPERDEDLSSTQCLDASEMPVVGLTYYICSHVELSRRSSGVAMGHLRLPEDHQIRSVDIRCLAATVPLLRHPAPKGQPTAWSRQRYK